MVFPSAIPINALSRDQNDSRFQNHTRSLSPPPTSSTFQNVENTLSQTIATFSIENVFNTSMIDYLSSLASDRAFNNSLREYLKTLAFGAASNKSISDYLSILTFSFNKTVGDYLPPILVDSIETGTIPVDVLIPLMVVMWVIGGLLGCFW